MNEEQKNKAKDAHGKLASWLEGFGVPSNWAKVGSALIIGAAIGGLSTCQQSCAEMPAPTAVQVQAVHDVYHAVSGSSCIFQVEDLQK
jgi:hypothetical protein